ncbi:MAG: Spy/CpxP family protein refolding chaperone [Bacteroidota bacterium]
METKSLLVGALLVFVGALLGFTISMVSTQDVPCRTGGKYAPGFYSGKAHHGYQGYHSRGWKDGKGTRNSYRSFDACVYDLDLTDEQKTKIEKIHAERDARRKEHRKAFRAEREQVYEQINEVLNDEQKKEFSEMREERRSQFKCKNRF